jgi:hypothetical protein
MAAMARPQAVANIRWYNTDCLTTSTEPLGCLAGALAAWRNLVCSGCIWDHKPIIQSYWNDHDPHYADVPSTNSKVYYDIWSNIHYGFVGRQAGFDRWTLIEGSHLAEAGGANAGDDVSITIGMDLFETYGVGGLTVDRLDNAIRSRLSTWRGLDNYHVRDLDTF